MQTLTKGYAKRRTQYKTLNANAGAVTENAAPMRDATQRTNQKALRKARAIDAGKTQISRKIILTSISDRSALS